MNKILFLILSIFFFGHVVRDVMQIKGMDNWLTTFAHFQPPKVQNKKLQWILNHSLIFANPRLEIVGLVLNLCLAIVFLYLYLEK